MFFLCVQLNYRMFLTLVSVFFVMFMSTSCLAFKMEPVKSYDNLQMHILQQYYIWKDTPYKYGGTDHHGIDCSSFTQHVIKKITNQNLPRTALAQSKLGTGVNMFRLRPGDLVFFGDHKLVRHVGIFWGHREFIHSSTSKGVTISSIDGYWKGRFISARRLTYNG